MNGDNPLPNPREKEIFWESLKLSTPEEAASYLNQACAGDKNLRASVESLLKNHKKEDLFEHTSDLVRHKKGDAINEYRIMDYVGAGGCAVVYRVEQDKPYYYQSALKLIKPGMDSRQMLTRFNNEWKTLTNLKHSSIVKVSDVGTTDYGSPYFVMEMIDGKEITEYCNIKKLSLTKRLKLFVKICSAVQCAHETGIIHRDIKPSNILVIEESGEPLPKVIDFGIAKVTGTDPSTKNTGVTATGQIIGTLAYMSPEQVQSDGQDIDKRTDVYSLGVLLYEILIGCLPLDMNGLGQYEQFRRIVEEKPKQPSVRFNNLLETEKVGIAQSHQTEPLILFKYINEDLDGIVMKCLEKKRSRRFETVGELANSIENILTDWAKKELILSEPKEPPSFLAIIKTIVEPFWLADSLWQSDSDRRIIAESKWYKSVEGIGSKVVIFLFPCKSIYGFYVGNYIFGFYYLFIVITYTYIAFLFRKWRKPLVSIPAGTSSHDKLKLNVKLGMILIAAFGILSYFVFLYFIIKSDNKLLVVILFYSFWLLPIAAHEFYKRISR